MNGTETTAPGKPLVLVVDDEPLVRAMCRAILDRNGFRHVIAENGRQGLEAFRELQPEIDLVLSDVSMPVMTGTEMVSEIFRIHPHSNVILMTGMATDELVPEYIARLCALVPKPFTAKQLLAEIRKCLKYEEKRELAEPAV